MHSNSIYNRRIDASGFNDFFQVHVKVFLFKHCQGHLYQLDHPETVTDRWKSIIALKDDKRTCSMEYDANFIG